jgi:hypothetical protein
MSLVERISVWREDPVSFVRDALRAEPEEWQAEALKAIVSNDRLAIRSGHGVGKSAFLAWVVLWWMLTRSPARIACTAPTGHQLDDILWAEIGIWYRKMPKEFQGLLTLTTDRVFMTESPSSYAVARTARRENPEALQGFHSRHMLFLIDEASGVDDIIFEVAQGAMSTAGAKTIMTGNPTRVSGYFFDAFHRMRNRWWTRRVPCQESSRVSRDYPEEIMQKYGEDSNVYRVRVLGDFPTGDDNSVIPLSLVEAARDREVEVPSVERIVWGVDVARFGADRCAIAKRSETRLLQPVQWWHGHDLMETSGRVMMEYRECHEWEKPEVILVDAIGYGAGVADRLREMGLPAKAVNVAELPGESDLYLRLRDELWFKAQEWFADRACKIPDDAELISELTSVGYEIRSSGKIKVDSKEEMKRKTSPARSPDLADAFVLTFARSNYGVKPDAPRKANNRYNPLNWRRRAA